MPGPGNPFSRLLLVPFVIVACLSFSQAQDHEGSLSHFMTVTVHGDYVARGVGLAETGEGTIVIDTIPDGARVVGGVLYWAFEDGPAQLSHRKIVINDTLQLSGELIGEVEYYWFHSYAYRALLSRDQLLYVGIDPDTGHLPPDPTGNGTYMISVNPGEGPTVPQGATLVLVYEHEGMLARDVVFNDGNVMPRVSPPPPFVYYARIPVAGFTVAAPAEGKCTFIVGEGERRGKDKMGYRSVWGRQLYAPGYPFDGSEGDFWDTESMSLDWLIQPGEQAGTAIVAIFATGGGLGFYLDDLIWVAHLMSVTTSNPVHPDPSAMFY